LHFDGDGGEGGHDGGVAVKKIRVGKRLKSGGGDDIEIEHGE